VTVSFAGLADRLRPRLQALVMPALALVTALVIGALVIVFSDPDTLHSWTGFFRHPGGTLADSWHLAADSYRALWDSSLGDADAVSHTLFEAAPLAFAGLSVALAFRAGLFNIGASGQLIVGAMCAGWVGFTWDLPAPLHLPLALLVGFAAGAGWGLIAGFLKARTGAHEVITTIMLNFVALRLLDYALRSDAFQRPGRDDPISPSVEPSARLPEISAGSFTVHAGILLAIAAAWLVWWLLTRSTVGFRMRAVGANPHASRCAGMRVDRTYMLAMLLAGGLAGLAGTTNVLGRASYSLTPEYFHGLGFEGIAVALLGRADPVGVVLSALLFGILRSGSSGMQAATATPIDIIGVIQALIIVFVAAPALIRAIYRVRVVRAAEPAFTTGWGS
jgi:general nucleoside transport system permease protein